MTKEEILNTLNANTHSLFGSEFISKVNTAFNVDIAERMYEADGDTNPKGLTTNDGSKRIQGLAAFDLALILCRKLGISYESKMGRGFQVRACTEAIKATLS